ncbi:vitelline membrane outer layer protein 1-like [Actinia tenebrosa]|uniref:Vitelline membrane outer layer protein 1-like n=1 Tax=Actinia tenebrosa TaxID=6105 RepID=A0A6P8H7G6_ACTTE|nr:vitelline membrane outer layer protein 1-like [Actinia tenebrosa]
MTMLFYALVLCLASCSVDARRRDYAGSIQPYTYTSWGSWGHEDWCPRGTYGYGFSLKVETYQGSGDDTSLNAIKLLCRKPCGGYPNSVTSRKGGWGRWSYTSHCPEYYFLHSAQARSESKQGSGDNTAANNYNFRCQNFKKRKDHYSLSGGGSGWGSWTGRRDCPYASYICGIKTQVERYQGSGDDTALNDAIFYCCYFIAEFQKSCEK